MFLHVIPKSKLRHKTGILTYRSDQPLAVGQLVSVPLRGRIVPGIVAKSKSAADITGFIQPVKGAGAILPLSFLRLVERVADHYGCNAAQALYYLAPQLKPVDVRMDIKIVDGTQSLYLTPSNQTPLFASLEAGAVTAGGAAAKRRQNWFAAAAGESITALGVTVAGWPFRHLKRVVIDTPFMSPYSSERTFGLNAATVAFLAAKIAGITPTVRTVLTASLLRRYFPIGPVTTARPRLHRLTLHPITKEGYLNQTLLAELDDCVRAGRPALILENNRPEEIAARLDSRFTGQVGLWQKGRAPAGRNITVATTTALFSQAGSFRQAFILSAESLISDQRPHSPLEALEILAIVASRCPVIIQFFRPDHWLIPLLRRQLVIDEDLAAGIPQFKHRLISIGGESFTLALQRRAATLWPHYLTDGDRHTFIAEQKLDPQQRQFLATLPAGCRVQSWATTLPKQSGSDRLKAR